jgi:hypothetical protein
VTAGTEAFQALTAEVARLRDSVDSVRAEVRTLLAIAAVQEEAAMRGLRVPARHTRPRGQRPGGHLSLVRGAP